MTVGKLDGPLALTKSPQIRMIGFALEGQVYARPGCMRSRFEYFRAHPSLQPGVVSIDSRRQGVQG